MGLFVVTIGRNWYNTGMESGLQSFLDRLAEVLEVPSVTPETDFRTVPMWSSMTGFAVMVMMDLDYGKGVTAADLKSARTVGDLAKLAGVVPA